MRTTAFLYGIRCPDSSQKRIFPTDFSAPYFTDFNRNGDPKHPDRDTDPGFGFLSQNIFFRTELVSVCLYRLPVDAPVSADSGKPYDKKRYATVFILTAIAYSVSGILIPFRGVEEAFTGFLPIFSSPFGSSCWNLAFPVLAYCLVSFSKHEENPARKKRILLILLIGTIASLVIAMLLMNYDLTAKHGKHMELIAQHAVLFPCCFIFYGLYEGFSGKSIRLPFSGKVLAEFSAATFGMFLIETHTGFSEQIFDFVASWFPHSAGPYLCSLLSIVLQLLLYFLAIFALRKIPPIRKIL